MLSPAFLFGNFVIRVFYRFLQLPNNVLRVDADESKMTEQGYV
jgi:hypothetical protein